MALHPNFDTIREMEKVNPLWVQSGFTWVHLGSSKIYTSLSLVLGISLMMRL